MEVLQCDFGLKKDQIKKLNHFPTSTASRLKTTAFCYLRNLDNSFMTSFLLYDAHGCLGAYHVHVNNPLTLNIEQNLKQYAKCTLIKINVSYFKRIPVFNICGLSIG